MEARDFWCIVYCSVLSMRYHPRNDSDTVFQAREMAKAAADAAVEDLHLWQRSQVQ